MLEQRPDTFRPQSLDLQQFQRGRWIYFKHLITTLEAAALLNFLQRRCDSLANSWDIGDFLLGILEDCRDSFRITLDRRRRVAITADAKPVLAGNFHQVGGFPEHARDFTIFHYEPFPLRAAIRGAVPHEPEHLRPSPVDASSDALPHGRSRARPGR